MSSRGCASLWRMSNPTQVPTTISNIGVAMFAIADQDAAIAFYTQTLGWELRADVARRGGRLPLGRGRPARLHGAPRAQPADGRRARWQRRRRRDARRRGRVRTRLRARRRDRRRDDGRRRARSRGCSRSRIPTATRSGSSRPPDRSARGRDPGAASGVSVARRAYAPRRQPVDVRGQPGARGELWVGDRRERLQRERDDAGPDVEVHVLVVVDGRAGADLRRRLVERQREHLRRLELLAVGRADVFPAARHEVLAERFERAQLLLGVVDERRRGRARSPSGSSRSGERPSARARCRRAASRSASTAPRSRASARAGSPSSRGGRRRRRRARAASG